MGGLVILAVVLNFFETPVLNVAISIISLLGVYEVLKAAGCLQNRTIAVITFAFAACIPFFKTQIIMQLLPIICYIFILVLFAALLKNHETMHVEQVGFIFFIGIIIPFSLTTAIYMRDSLGLIQGIYYTGFALTSAWMADTGAYFAGLFWGKRKLAPLISPKKTVEGAIGGAVISTLSVLLYSAVFAWLTPLLFGGQTIQINYPVILLAAPFLVAASIVGDLSASVIKRQNNVKDFGSIMPGHGGIMDRFDSVLLVVPAVYILSQHIPLVTLLSI